MKRVIWKFPLSLDSGKTTFTLKMPRDAEVLSVGAQGTLLCMWALVDVEQGPEERRFSVRATGEVFEHDHAHQFIGTVSMPTSHPMMPMMPLVWHIFELQAEKHRASHDLPTELLLSLKDLSSEEPSAAKKAKEAAKAAWKVSKK